MYAQTEYNFVLVFASEMSTVSRILYTITLLWGLLYGNSSHYHKADFFCHMPYREGQFVHSQVSTVRWVCLLWGSVSFLVSCQIWAHERHC